MPAILALLFALWAGLLRLGWTMPNLTPSLAMTIYSVRRGMWAK